MRYNPTPYRPQEGERFCVEMLAEPAEPARAALYEGRGTQRRLVIPGQRARPAQYRGFGAMPTAALNNMPTVGHKTLVPVPVARAIDCGAAGEFLPRMRRQRRADGTRRAYVPQTEGRPVQRADLMREADARALVRHALAKGEFIHRGRRIRVLPCPTGAIRTIPDKGSICKWASAEDFAQAIATGAF